VEEEEDEENLSNDDVAAKDDSTRLSSASNAFRQKRRSSNASDGEEKQEDSSLPNERGDMYSSPMIDVNEDEKFEDVLLTLKGHEERVFSVCITSDGRRIISGSLDQTVKVCNAQTGDRNKGQKRSENPVYVNI